jgi:hypothetical protein
MKLLAVLAALCIVVALLARRRPTVPWHSWDWPEGSAVPWYYADADRSDDGWGLFT